MPPFVRDVRAEPMHCARRIMRALVIAKLRLRPSERGPRSLPSVARFLGAEGLCGSFDGEQWRIMGQIVTDTASYNGRYSRRYDALESCVPIRKW